VQGCDTLATCQGSWQTQGPTDDKCGATLDQGCPATFDTVPVGSACKDTGLVCNYLRGRCACVESLGGPVQLLDGSVQGHWACQNPGNAACPVPRAPLGSPCSPAGPVCDYGSCSIPGGSAEQCEGGIWKPVAVACPVFAAPAH
jgi:hypothetical protein